MTATSSQAWKCLLLLLLPLPWLTGCGTIKGQTASDQLLVSDAVDQTLSQMSFAELGGRNVFLDTQYVRSVHGIGSVNSSYIISAMRELMIRDGCQIQENKSDADVVVELRIGALGTDNHEVNYGVPGSSTVNQTASLLTSTPFLPSIPEVSLAKKDERRAAAKIAVFAYDRETKVPVWQTGTMLGLSHAKSTWILGAGPFYEGHIYDSTGLETAPVAVSMSGDEVLGKLPYFANWFRRDKSENRGENVASADRFSPASIAREKELLADNAPKRLPEVIIQQQVAVAAGAGTEADAQTSPTASDDSSQVSAAAGQAEVGEESTGIALTGGLSP